MKEVKINQIYVKNLIIWTLNGVSEIISGLGFCQDCVYDINCNFVVSSETTLDDADDISNYTEYWDVADIPAYTIGGNLWDEIRKEMTK